MDTSKLESKLDAVVQQLKQLAVGGVVDDRNSKGRVVGKKLTNEEKTKIRLQAKEQADVFKSVLGLGYKDKDAQSLAKVIKDTLNIDQVLKDNNVGYSDANSEAFSRIFKNTLDFQQILKELNEDTLSALSDIFKNSFNFTPSFTGLNETVRDGFSSVLTHIIQILDIIKNKESEGSKKVKDILSSIVPKGAKKSGKSDINYLLKEMEWSDYFDWIKSISRGIQFMTEQMDIVIGLIRRLTEISVTNKKEKKGGFLSGLGDLKNIGILALMGVGLFLVVGALVASGKIDIGKTIKVLAIIGLIIGVFVLASKLASGFKSAAIGFAILSATLLLLVVPLIQKLAKIPFQEIANGLGKMILVVGVSLLIMYAMKKIKPKDTLQSMAGFLSFLLIIGFIAIPLIQYLASMPLETFVVGLLKMIVITAVSLVLMNFLKKFNKTDTLKSVGGFALFLATIGLVVIPMLQKLAKMKLSDILQSLFKFGLIVLTTIGLMALMNRIKPTDTIKSTAGFLLFALTLSFVIIPMLKKLVDFKAEQIVQGILKMGGIALASIGVLYLMSKIKPANVLMSSLGLLALSLILGFVIVPLLKFLSVQPFEEMLDGLKKAGLAIIGLGVIVRLLGMIVGKGILQIIVGMVAILALSFLVGYMADRLNALAGKPWKEIMVGLGFASLALTAFGLLVAGIGALVTLPPVAWAMGVGAVAVFGLIYLMGYLADNLNKFKDVDPDKLTSVGKALSILGKGLVDFMGGSVGGVVGGIATAFGNFFSINPVDQIKKFQELDGDKLLKVGTGVKFLGEGLRNLSSGIDLKGITKDLVNMTTPLMQFSAAITAFSIAYKALEALKLESKIKVDVNSDNGIQKAILDIQTQELEVQKAQLEQLRMNGQLLSRIAESGGMGGIGASPKGNSISSPTFKTKDGYLNNMKLMNMSFQA